MHLHPKLLADTLPICITEIAQVRLMNDRRWPWLILLPTEPGIDELHDFSDSQRDLFMADVNRVSRALQQMTQCRSINVAMLGNVVSQLHCHVVARDEGDPNWPDPVWGFAGAVPYVGNESLALSDAVRQCFE